jgi:ubiquinone/menaquinone biosynthesis C-methylase UbiE
VFEENTKHSYDKNAQDYATWIEGELATKPWDRAVLTTFAELAEGPAADVGCGTGRITSYLNERGLKTLGLDLSRQMVATAKRTHPNLDFSEASMTALPLATASLGALVAWYSTIHIPDTHLPGVLKEFERTLKPGGHLQLAFQAGTKTEHRTKAGTHEVNLDFHHREPEQMANLLKSAGLDVVATLQRAPDKEGPYSEDAPQAYVLARKPPHA